MKPSGIVILTTAALTAISGCVLDVSLGSRGGHNTTVVGRWHKPAWTEVETEYVPGTDGRPGHYKTVTTRHPDQYFLYTTADDALSVSAAKYHRTEIGQQVSIYYREGRWTGLHYFARVEPAAAPE